MAVRSIQAAIGGRSCAMARHGPQEHWLARCAPARRKQPCCTLCAQPVSPGACLAARPPAGVVDHIGAIAAVTRRHGCCLHVDACLGGYCLPFVRKLGYPVPAFDFSVRGVTSMSVRWTDDGRGSSPQQLWWWWLMSHATGVPSGPLVHSVIPCAQLHARSARGHCFCFATRPGAARLQARAARSRNAAAGRASALCLLLLPMPDAGAHVLCMLPQVDTHKFGMAHKGTSVVLYHSPDLRQYQYTSITDWTGGLYISPGGWAGRGRSVAAAPPLCARMVCANLVAGVHGVVHGLGVRPRCAQLRAGRSSGPFA